MVELAKVRTLGLACNAVEHDEHNGLEIFILRLRVDAYFGFLIDTHRLVTCEGTLIPHKNLCPNRNSRMETLAIVKTKASLLDELKIMFRHH